ncbi:hypothetical protein IPZ58_16785 [Streptomyces roseoverticillatus]|uniref:hypothetical protein n=1 Tax=Streptomyces roseoverticillatus TaxID=66429 RepID=UPI001F352D37|nr:hypothetical protein [Streptomyces roseoverticillatus]MCF3103222.1 hypothetical protein [Streptomyces roseoverticillatus]
MGLDAAAGYGPGVLAVALLAYEENLVAVAEQRGDDLEADQGPYSRVQAAIRRAADVVE